LQFFRQIFEWDIVMSKSSGDNLLNAEKQVLKCWTVSDPKPQGNWVQEITDEILNFRAFTANWRNCPNDEIYLLRIDME